MYLSFMVASACLPTYKHFSHEHHIASCCSLLRFSFNFSSVFIFPPLPPLEFISASGSLHPSHSLISSPVFPSLSSSPQSPHPHLPSVSLLLAPFLSAPAFLSFSATHVFFSFFLCYTCNSPTLAFSEKELDIEEKGKEPQGDIFIIKVR